MWKGHVIQDRNRHEKRDWAVPIWWDVGRQPASRRLLGKSQGHAVSQQTCTDRILELRAKCADVVEAGVLAMSGPHGGQPSLSQGRSRYAHAEAKAAGARDKPAFCQPNQDMRAQHHVAGRMNHGGLGARRQHPLDPVWSGVQDASRQIRQKAHNVQKADSTLTFGKEVDIE